MKPKPPCPACGHPPASMIEDGYSIDLTPWWRYYAQKFNPFKRRRRMVPMDDVVPLIDSLKARCGCETCSTTSVVCTADRSDACMTVQQFLSKHPLP